MDTLVFRLDRQRFGLPLAEVVEVLPAVELTPLPEAPPIVEGVIDVRGRIVPVLDVRSRFRVPPRPMDASDHLLLARAGAREVALRVDEAVDLVPLGDVTPTEEVVPGAAYVSGVARVPDGLILIHDLRTFLSAAEAEQLDRALAGDGA